MSVILLVPQKSLLTHGNHLEMSEGFIREMTELEDLVGKLILQLIAIGAHQIRYSETVSTRIRIYL